MTSVLRDEIRESDTNSTLSRTVKKYFPVALKFFVEHAIFRCYVSRGLFVQYQSRKVLIKPRKYKVAYIT